MIWFLIIFIYIMITFFLNCMSSEQILVYKYQGLFCWFFFLCFAILFVDDHDV